MAEATEEEEDGAREAARAELASAMTSCDLRFAFLSDLLCDDVEGS